jgi:hypothetical protein
MFACTGQRLFSTNHRITCENLISHENMSYARKYELPQARDASHEDVRAQKMSGRNWKEGRIE